MDIIKISKETVEGIERNCIKICDCCSGLGSTCKKCELTRIINYLRLKSEEVDDEKNKKER